MLDKTLSELLKIGDEWYKDKKQKREIKYALYKEVVKALNQSDRSVETLFAIILGENECILKGICKLEVNIETPVFNFLKNQDPIRLSNAFVEIDEIKSFYEGIYFFRDSIEATLARKFASFYEAQDSAYSLEDYLNKSVRLPISRSVKIDRKLLRELEKELQTKTLLRGGLTDEEYERRRKDMR